MSPSLCQLHQLDLEILREVGTQTYFIILFCVQC